MHSEDGGDYRALPTVAQVLPSQFPANRTPHSTFVVGILRRTGVHPSLELFSPPSKLSEHLSHRLWKMIVCNHFVAHETQNSTHLVLGLATNPEFVLLNGFTPNTNY